MKPSLTRSVVESRKAPNGVDLAAGAGERAVEDVEDRARDEERRAEPVEEDLVAVLEEDDDRRGERRGATPVVVSAFGVTRVRASPTIERDGERRARPPCSRA